MAPAQNQRVIAFIDGFNLYFGLKAKRWQRYYWLNLQALMRNILKPDQHLVHTKYFTARVQGPPTRWHGSRRFSMRWARFLISRFTMVNTF